MVETKADEEDEEGFGEFTFASFPRNQVIHSTDQINGRKSTIADNEDDEWGDFVESPLQSVPSKPFEPFGFFSDHSKSTTTPSPTTESVPSRDRAAAESDSDNIRWVKPKGALPLSIFGDVVDEEEEQSGVDPPVGDKHAGNVRNGSNIFIGLAMNDIVANPYTDHNQQIKAENGFNSNSNSNGSNSDLPPLNYGQSTQIKTVSRLSSNSDLFAANNDSHSPQIKAVTVNGLNLNSDLFAGNNDSQGLQIEAVNGLNLNADLVSGNFDFDAFINPHSQNHQNNAFENSNGLNMNLNASTSNLNGVDSNLDGLISNSDPPGNDGLDGDEDGWEFKDAYSESNVGDGNHKVDRKEQLNYEVTGFSSDFGSGSHGSIDLFSASNGFSGKPREVDISFDFKPLTVAQNGFSSDSFFKSEHNGTENGLHSYPVVGTVDSDEIFGDFEGACTGSGLKQEDEPKVNDLSHSEVEAALACYGKAQGNEIVSKNHQGALPLSIFGDEELETVDSLDVQDDFTYKPSSHSRNGTNSQDSNISINDLISNLYSQAEQIPSDDYTEKLTGNGLASDKVVDPSLVNCDDDFDDTSWEFKDASSQIRAIDQISLCSPGDAHQNISTKLKLNNYVDFYCKLKDKLSFVCRCHLDTLKEAQNTAALSGEDAKVIAIEEEIQEACKVLHKENIDCKEYSEDKPPRDICLNEFLEVLHELKFQVLESEYHLSRRLHLAENDLRSAIELMQHAASMLNVLTLGSVEDQYIYVSTWSKMISVCDQELKHGSWIWKQLVEKNLRSWILSDPRGKRFILALGEIYRVVVVLGASTKLYKPWILLSSVDSTSIYALLEECYTLWSSSGLEEALQGISDPVDFEYHSTVKALWESIKYIHDLDLLALGNYAFNQQVSVCWLSLLASEAVPEMKMVFWSGEDCFLTLANLWANLISCDPPELPHLHVGPTCKIVGS